MFCLDTFHMTALAIKMSQHNERPRDRVYAWIVCASAVLSSILMFGCSQSFGLILPALLKEFHESKAITAWVGSIALALPLTVAPLASWLINRFGARTIGMTGGMIAALGLTLTSFATSISTMFVTFGVIYGFGVSLPYTACYDIVPKYFKKKLGVAMGIMTSGAGATVFVMSPINEVLISNVGWRKAFLAFAGFLFLAGVCCLAFSPYVEKDHLTTQGRQQASRIVLRQSTPLHKNGRYILTCAYSFLFQLGNTIPLFHLGRYALDSGLTSSQSANLYIGFGASSMIGRVVSGKICEFKSHHLSYICCCCSAVVASACNLMVPFMKGFLALTIYFCINGLADGFHVTSKHVFMIEICSMQQTTSAFGFLFFITSMSYLLGPPLGGLIADQAGSYIPAFYTSGSLVLSSVLVILAIKCIKQKDKETTINEVKDLVDDQCFIERVTVL